MEISSRSLAASFAAAVLAVIEHGLAELALGAMADEPSTETLNATMETIERYISFAQNCRHRLERPADPICLQVGQEMSEFLWSDRRTLTPPILTEEKDEVTLERFQQEFRWLGLQIDRLRETSRTKPSDEHAAG